MPQQASKSCFGGSKVRTGHRDYSMVDYLVTGYLSY
jgi:hypothetical protein